MAAKGRSPLRGESSGNRVQLRGGGELAREERLGGGGKLDCTSEETLPWERSHAAKNKTLFFVQSYCGRFAVTTALSVLHAIRARQLKLKPEGVALGNNWMSPKDYVVSRILNQSIFFQLSNESNLKSPCIFHGGLCSETC